MGDLVKRHSSVPHFHVSRTDAPTLLTVIYSHIKSIKPAHVFRIMQHIFCVRQTSNTSFQKNFRECWWDFTSQQRTEKIFARINLKFLDSCFTGYMLNLFVLASQHSSLRGTNISAYKKNNLYCTKRVCYRNVSYTDTWTDDWCFTLNSESGLRHINTENYISWLDWLHLKNKKTLKVKKKKKYKLIEWNSIQRFLHFNNPSAHQSPYWVNERVSCARPPLTNLLLSHSHTGSRCWHAPAAPFFVIILSTLTQCNRLTRGSVATPA